MAKFSGGKWAWSICDRCGLRYDYTAVRTETDTNFRVCLDCLDEPNPYLRLKVEPDAIALLYPRPDTNIEEYINLTCDNVVITCDNDMVTCDETGAPLE